MCGNGVTIGSENIEALYNLIPQAPNWDLNMFCEEVVLEMHRGFAEYHAGFPDLEFFRIFNGDFASPSLNKPTRLLCLLG